MSLLKRIVGSEAGRRAIGALGAGYIRLVYATTRWTTVGRATPERFWAEGRPFIGCFWHGRILLMPYIWGVDRPCALLISKHADGRLIAETVSHFGFDTIAGSSSSGGSDALRAIVRALKAGSSVGITPDGPRGPRMRTSAGVVQAARLAGAPLLPVSVATSRRKMLDSWDRFLVALPFGRGAVVWGRALEIAADADEAEIEAVRLALEDELNRVSAEADRLVGRTPVEPA
ncbi:MAG: DUF374 domain-containing protein [Alphaproteobacteria bacterium]|nr:DUF374 domain-containing protein [Alphaproteobacteria bacterium]